MNFQGRGRPFTGAGLKNALATMGLDPDRDLSRLWAILTVESRGFGFGADRRPKILFERHVFRRQTNGRFDETAPDLSNPEPGGYNDGSQYDRLQRAIALLAAEGEPPEAALRSASWGLGQVMGFNFADSGHSSATDFVRSLLNDENQHLLAMADFIRKHQLGPKLQADDWTAVALVYNGEGQQDYDLKLADAFSKFEAGVTRDLSIRTAQAALLYLGFGAQMGDVDGILGDNTRRAILAWRISAGLPASDDLDRRTFDALMTAVGF